MFVLTSENMRKAEESAVAKGSDFYTLMETAGTRCARVIADEEKTCKVTVLCGKGKNGGDGFVIARKLREYGFKNVFAVLIYGEPTDPLCLDMYEQMKKYPVTVADMTNEAETAAYHILSADVLADSIFGIGFKGELSGNAEKAIKLANENVNARKYAIDIPSGLTADGSFDGKLYFKTDRTLTMIAYKPVQVLLPTAELCGDTQIMDIGIGEEILEPFAEKYICLTKNDVLKNIGKRAYDSHKGTFGNVLTVCGSRNMTGCVYLCNRAAVEIGAGLVSAAFPECIYNAVTSKLNEPLMVPVAGNENGRMIPDAKILLEKLEKSDAVAVGCGIGVDNDTKELVKFVIENCTGTLILDADGLNCIAKDVGILKNAVCDIIVTPHPGEMARLTGKSVAEIQSDRVGTALGFAEEYGVTVLLKGANTVIADKNGRLCINKTGNPGMARGGSGDVLTGIIAGLVRQTADAFTAACTGAFIHGYVADKIAREHGHIAATPSRVAENLYLFNK